VPYERRVDRKVMVSVAQLVESRIVIPVVVGSSPIAHPISVRVQYLALALRTLIIDIGMYQLRQRRSMRGPRETSICFGGVKTRRKAV
jgi:hypothetical protein